MKKIFLAALCATTAMSFAQTAANIDDFEDGDGTASTGRNDSWYAYTTGTGSAITNAKNAYDGYDVVLQDAAAGGSKYGAAIKGIALGSGGTAALGVNIAGGLNGCTAISYKYKGAAHVVKPTMKGDEEGELTEWNQHKKAVVAASDWTPVSIPVSQFVQEDWGGKGEMDLDMQIVNAIKWEVSDATGANYLYIDDVNCADLDRSGPVITGSAVIIDDFEDGNTVADSISKTTYWYIYTSKATVSNEQDATKTWDMIDSTDDGSSHWAAMKGISGIEYGSDKNKIYTSAGIGMDLKAGVFTNCKAITYSYRGSGHRMRGYVTGVTEDAGEDHVSNDMPASTEWATVTVATMEQPEWAKPQVAFSWSKVSKLAWVVDEKISDATSELDIDDVKCIGTLTSPTSSSSAATTTTSSASNEPASSASKDKDDDDTAIGTVASISGLTATLHGNTLQVSVAKAGLVKVQVFDMMGHAIESHSENMTAGSFAHSFANMSKGAYIIRVQQGSMVKTVRMQVR